MRFQTLPDELADALGRVVADVQRQARKDVELINAKSETIIAQLSARIFELESKITSYLEREVQRVTDAVASIKNGDPGPPGAPGEKGDAGEKGDIGEPGKDGDTGEPGKNGDSGPIGPPGRIGDTGLAGAPGERGEKGEKGEPGEAGDPGRDGIDGKDGDVGPGVDPEAVAKVVSENVKQAFSQLPKLPTSFLVNEAGILTAAYEGGDLKPIGKVRGDDGARGASIMDGTVGSDGVLTLRMSDGRQIQVGAVRGEAGRDGKDGSVGARGRDANEIRVLPGIDETKSYPENTSARWRGGVIMADRQTDPVVDGNIAAAGWGIAMEGIAEEVENVLEDGRILERVTTYTSGKKFSRRIDMATPIYRGIWREGDYRRGDSVTFGGSSFIAIRNTSSKPETEDSGWQLSIKRGRDGKDGKPGEKGEKGEKGAKGDRGYA